MRKPAHTPEAKARKFVKTFINLVHLQKLDDRKGFIEFALRAVDVERVTEALRQLIGRPALQRHVKGFGLSYVFSVEKGRDIRVFIPSNKPDIDAKKTPTLQFMDFGLYYSNANYYN